MSNDNKIIRISGELEANSFRAIDQVLQNITRQAHTTAEALAQVSQRMGGGGAPMGVTGAAGAAAAGAQGPLARPNLDAWGKPLKQAADEARGAGRAIGDMARAAEGPLRSLQEHIRGALDGLLKIRATAYGAPSTSTFQRPTAPGPQYGPHATDVPYGPGVSAYRTNLSARIWSDAHGTLEPTDGNAIIRSEEGQLSSRLRARGYHGGRGGPPLAGYGPSGGGGMDDEGPHKAGFAELFNQTPLGSALAMAGRYALPAGLAYAGYKAVDAGTQAFAKVDTTNTGEALEHAPWYDARLRAAAGRTFGGNAVGLMGGDLGLSRAIQRVNEDAEAKRLMSPETTTMRLSMAGHKAGLPSVVDERTGKDLTTASGYTLGNMWNKISGDAAAGFVRVMRGGTHDFTESIAAAHKEVLASGGTELEAQAAARAQVLRWGKTHGNGTMVETEAQIAYQREVNQIPVTKMEERQRRIDMERQSDPMFQHVADRLMGSAFGTLATSRQAGISQREIFDKNNQFQGYGVDLFAARMKGRGFGEGEGTAARAAAGRMAGRGNMGLGEAIMGAHAGGLFNATELLGAGAQMGGQGGPLGLFRAVQSAIGGGGLDITAGSELSGVIAQMAQRGHGELGANHAMRTLLGATSLPGRGAGGDLRAARMAAEGLQQTGDLFGGKVDPLGAALTRRAALTGAGDLGPYAADALERVLANPVELTEIMTSGVVPKGLQGLGLEFKNVETAVREQNLQNVVRIVRKGLRPGTAGGAFAERLIAAGGDMAKAQSGLTRATMGEKDFAQMMLLRGKKSLTKAERVTSDRLEGIAEAKTEVALRGFGEIEASDTGDKRSPDAVYESLKARAAMGGFGRVARGGGAGWKIPKDSPEAIAADLAARLEVEESKAKHEKKADVKKAADGVTTLAAAEEEARKIAASGGPGSATDLKGNEKRLSAAVGVVATALTGLARKIEAVNAAPYRAGP